MERFFLELPARIIATDENVVDAASAQFLTSNISAGGAYFITDKPFSVGTMVKIDLILPVDKLSNLGGKKSRIYVSGSVIRTDKNGMALHFDKSYNMLPYQKNT